MRRSVLRPPVASVLVGLGLIVTAIVLAGQRDPGMDSTVYQGGALAVLRGDPLYDSLHIPPPWADLPFTYPPIAAILFIPLAPLPMHMVWGVMAAVCALALGITMRHSLASLLRREPPAWAVNILALLPFALQPVWSTVGLGQINLLLMALVVVDVLAIRRYGGILIGVAAAIKLTPLIFIPHLLLTRRWADAARATATFLVLQGIGWLLLPSDSLRFWTSAMMEGNGGRTFEAANQSLNGLVQRLTGGSSDALAISIALGVLCLAVHAILVRRLHALDQPLAALLATAFCGLLVSPVTWTHHWVWVVPLCLLLGYRAVLRNPSLGALLILVLVAFSVDFRLFVPIGDRLELRWTALETLVGNAYLLAAVLVGLAAVMLVANHMLDAARPQLRFDGPSIPAQRTFSPADAALLATQLDPFAGSDTPLPRPAPAPAPRRPAPAESGKPATKSTAKSTTKPATKPGKPLASTDAAP